MCCYLTPCVLVKPVPFLTLYKMQQKKLHKGQLFEYSCQQNPQLQTFLLQHTDLKAGRLCFFVCNYATCALPLSICREKVMLYTQVTSKSFLRKKLDQPLSVEELTYNLYYGYSTTQVGWITALFLFYCFLAACPHCSILFAVQGKACAMLSHWQSSIVTCR